MANTDFDSKNPTHVEAQRKARPVRPTHSFCSAWFLRGVALPAGWRLAVLLGILTHHGGWAAPPEVDDLCSEAEGLMGGFGVPAAVRAGFQRGRGETFLDGLEGDLIDDFEMVWPGVAMVMRLVRLADQRAAAEAGSGE